MLLPKSGLPFYNSFNNYTHHTRSLAAGITARLLVIALHLFGWEVECLGVMLEMAFVATIAKRLVGRKATTADRNHRAALKAIYIALCVYYFKIAVNFHRAVAVYRKSGFGHSYLVRWQR